MHTAISLSSSSTARSLNANDHTAPAEAPNSTRGIPLHPQQRGSLGWTKISSRCCLEAQQRSREQHALHKQTFLHRSSLRAHLAKHTSGSISSPLLIANEGVSNQKQQLS